MVIYSNEMKVVRSTFECDHCGKIESCYGSPVGWREFTLRFVRHGKEEYHGVPERPAACSAECYMSLIAEFIDKLRYEYAGDDMSGVNVDCFDYDFAVKLVDMFRLVELTLK